MSLWNLLRLVPKNHLSIVLGGLARIPLPQVLAAPLLQWFVRFYNIDVDEASRPLNEYSCLGKFFIRDLREGTRPQGSGLVSPIDGTLREAGPIHRGILPQVKGREYTVQRLLADDSMAEQFNNGWFFSLYLSPRDYHHVHSPVEGTVDRLLHIPGKLWPVNSWSLENIDCLFGVNERVVFFMQTAAGPIAVVMVGATNVGRISVPFHPLVTNGVHRLFRISSGAPRQYDLDPGVNVEKGERLGTFHLGSSVVLLLPPDWPVGELAGSGSVELGETLMDSGS